MGEYASNSHKSKEKRSEQVPEKKVEKIVSGSVKAKKKSGLQKITNVFVPEDVDNVKSYILEDIVVPAVKDIILDAVKAVLGVKSSGDRRPTVSKVSYRKYYEDPAQNSRRNYNAQSSIGGCDFDDIYFNTRTEAENVLTAMDEIVASYKIVSVADYFDLVGVDGPWTGNNYGWTDNIRNARVVKTRDGYTIKFPRANPID